MKSTGKALLSPYQHIRSCPRTIGFLPVDNIVSAAVVVSRFRAMGLSTDSVHQPNRSYSTEPLGII